MAYLKQTWNNLPDTSTPITAARLGHLETQYDEAVAYTDEAIANSGGGGSASEVDLVSRLRFPVFIGHRGAPLSYPEHSIEGYRACLEAGFSPEADVRALADGTLVNIHNATTGATMSVSSTVSTMTPKQWAAARVKPPVGNGKVYGSGPGTPAFFEDYLDEFGGRVVLWPEIKVDNIAPSVIKAVKDRNLQKAVVLQCNSLSVAQLVVSEGVYAALSSAAGATPSEAKAAGVDFMIVPRTQGAAYLASCVAAGVKPIVWTVNNAGDAADLVSQGAAGIFSDDCWEASRVFTPVQSVEGVIASGWIPPATVWGQRPDQSPVGTKQEVRVRGGVLDYTHGDSDVRANSLKLGILGEGAGSCKIRLWVQANEPAPSATPEGGWLFGIYFGKTQSGGAAVEFPNSEQWRLAMIRRNGEKNVYDRPSFTGTTTRSGTNTATEPYAKPGGRGTAMLFEVEFTPTQVAIRNLSRGDVDLVATTSNWGSSSGNYVSLCVTGGNSSVWGVHAVI